MYRPPAKPNLVLIESDAPYQLKLKNFLLNQDLNVICASTAEEALSLIQWTLPQVIVLASDLSNGESLELIKRLKLNFNYRIIPILALLPQESPIAILPLYESGCDAHISKAENFEMIFLKIQGLLRTSHHPVPSFSDLPPPTLEEEEHTFTNKRIVLVDPDEISLFNIKKHLENIGYQVETSTNAEECFDLLISKSPDLVLMEHSLPDLHSSEITRQVRSSKRFQNIPIIIVTPTNEDGFLALQSGANDFIIKSSQLKPLELKINALMKALVFEEEACQIRNRFREAEKKALQAQAEKDAQSRYASELSEVNNHLEALYHELAIKNQELEHLDKLKSEFISTVSHELRTPLTITKMAISNLLDGVMGAMTDKQREVVDTAYKNINRLSRLINDLLDLSRLESGQSKLNRRQVFLSNLVSECVDSFQEMAKQKNLDLHFNNPQPSPLAYADPDMIHQVITNILSNALHYSHSKITVTLEGLKLSIQDDGPGISEENQTKLFGKFFQINRPLGGAGYKGTGLGLAISKKIIDLNGGNLGVQSILGKGSCFYFTLPAWDDKNHLNEIIHSQIVHCESEKRSLAFISVPCDHLKDLSKEEFLDLTHRKILKLGDIALFLDSENAFLLLCKARPEGMDNLKDKVSQHITSFGFAAYPQDGVNISSLLEKSLSSAS